jgi:hypothetical protein
MDELETREDGPATLLARVAGNSIPELKLAALDQAREFYGPEAELRVTGLEKVRTNWAAEDGEGKWWTTATVECLNLPAEDR